MAVDDSTKVVIDGQGNPVGPEVTAGTPLTATVSNPQSVLIYTWTLADGQGTPTPLPQPQANPLILTAPHPGKLALTAHLGADPTQRAAVPVTVKSLDFNGDGVLDVLDLAWLAKAYGTRRGDPSFSAAVDLNGDHRVGEDDAREFLAQLDR